MGWIYIGYGFINAVYGELHLQVKSFYQPAVPIVVIALYNIAIIVLNCPYEPCGVVPVRLCWLLWNYETFAQRLKTLTSKLLFSRDYRLWGAEPIYSADDSRYSSYVLYISGDNFAVIFYNTDHEIWFDFGLLVFISVILLVFLCMTWISYAFFNYILFVPCFDAEVSLWYRLFWLRPCDTSIQ